MLPLYVRHVAGKNEKVYGDQATLFTVLKGKTELQLVSANDALAASGRTDGNFWGFLKQIDAKKRVAFKPAEALYVTPKHVSPGDMTVDNAGYFSGFRAASEPERTWEYIAPKLVMHSGGSKASFEPKPNSGIVRFVAAKKISIPAGSCFRVH